MKFSDLFRDPATGQLSHTKLWNNIVNLVITAIVIDLHVRLHAIDQGWILLYAGIVGTVGVASKYLSMRYGLPAEPAPTPTGATQ